jgi:hypothetical protein
MCRLATLLGTGLFFAPFIYVPLYLYIERSFSHHARVQYVLRISTLLGGLLVIIYACTTPLDFMVLMPSRGGAKNYVPASIFLVIAGVAIMTLPFYSKYIKFSNMSN